MKRVVWCNNKVLAVYAFSPTVVLVCSGAVCAVCLGCCCWCNMLQSRVQFAVCLG